MTITKWAIKQKKWSIFWWGIGVSGLIVLTLAFYPTIRNQTSQLDKSFNQIPQSAKSLFTDTQDLFSPVGYLSSQLYYLMLPMLLSILGIGLGSSLLAKEENDNTIELLLSRPISRSELAFEKSLAGLFIVSFIGGAALLVTIIMCKLVHMDVSLVGVAVATIYATILAILFGAIAFLISSLGRSGRLASIGLSALIALGGYIVSSLESVVSWLKWPAKLFPTHYYHPGDILSGTYSWHAALGMLVVAVALSVLSVVAFRRRGIA